AGYHRGVFNRFRSSLRTGFEAVCEVGFLKRSCVHSFSDMHLPPIAFALLVVVVLGVVGAVISVFRGRSSFGGYEDLAPDARAVAKSLTDSEVFRDGSDLVVSGNFQKL